MLTMAFTRSERADLARKVVAQPQNYKICRGCDSIIDGGQTICPFCHGYGFDTDEKDVQVRAVELSIKEELSIPQEWE
jgi:DnaJ-class molecular chaperone